MADDNGFGAYVRKSVGLRQRSAETIDAEIAQRVGLHQDRINRLRSGQRMMIAAGRTVSEPLVLLAQGDSWFDYPLDGNSLTLSDTDIIAQLRGMGTTNPTIINTAHHGDTAVGEMSLPKQQRMIELLQDSSNWLSSGKPDAILFSAGGNDIAGDEFCIILDDETANPSGVNEQRLTGILASIEACYRDLFAFRDRHAPGVPVFGHCYDFPLPNGAHPSCIGPWLKPSLDFIGWNYTDGARICRSVLQRFKTMLEGLARERCNNFCLVDTQGTLDAADWANELHPYPVGFSKLAEKFLAALRSKFDDRV